MRARGRWLGVGAPVVVGVVAVALWQAVVTGLGVEAFVVPAPSDIAAELGANLAVVTEAALATATNALLGLVLGTVLALVGAAVSAAWRPVADAANPLVTATAVVPIVCLAPVFYTMFGSDAQTTRVVVAAIAVFVPVYINTLRGLRTVEPVHRDLMRSYAATPWEATRHVTLPGALPFFFTGLRVASSLAVISALVAEYFGGPVDGLGKAITSAVSSSRYALAWAYVLGAVATGLVFYAVTALIERNTMHRKNVLRTSLGLATAVALAGCSGASAEPEAGGLTPVTLQLQWVAQAQFAGYYAAVDQGYYEDEGLDVTVQEAGTDTVPIDVLAAGDADYAISWVPKVLGSIEQGTEVTNVAQVFERSGTLQVAFAGAGIAEPADLAGKKVGSWGYGNEWELFAGMQDAGIQTPDDIELVQQAFDMNGFLAGDIDAAQAMTYNEYAQILETVNPETGELYQPEDLEVIDWNDHGTAMLQDAIWADAARLADDEAYADTTVGFVKASLKGWAYVRDNPEEAAGIVTAAGSTLGASHQLWQTNEVNKLIWPSTSGIGTVNADQWDQTVEIAMGTQNETGATVISAEPPETAYTNEYVEQALAELAEEGVDIQGEEFEALDVQLTEGGS